ncbi:gliding motility-associated C-terminal domain-containing protein [Flavobacterium sp. NPDC079362]|uniref:gliding motility-associated C-terminal domain-containing protein n=1 Tax=Flavobacterium sp. NPDC079362 TaxID=3390566 RepID=UPI003CFCBFC7
MIKNYTNFLLFVLFFVFLSVLPSQMAAQCAGNDAQKIICDIQDAANKTLSLFSLLDGSPIAGGKWSDDNNFRGLDSITGNLNAQLIRKGGVYHYTYTAPDVAGCVDNKSTITLTIGAYAGIGSKATVCSEAGGFNLFTAFDSTVMGPHENGIWRDASGRILGSSLLEIGKIEETITRKFTYEVPVVPECPLTPLVTTVFVTIVRTPEQGKSIELRLCGTTDLDGYTNFDMFELLTGEDPDGVWKGPDITTRSDHNINLKQLFDTYGASQYNYEYTVFAVPNQNVCKDKTAYVTITLEKKIDFTGTKIAIAKDICESDIATAAYSAKITQGPQNIPNGEYKITYSVAGPTGGSESITANFINGIADFLIESSYFKRVGKYTVTVTSIIPLSGKGLCANMFSPFSSDLNIYPLPRLNNAVITASPVCQNNNATIQISNATQLTDGDYRIVYNINGDNLATAQTANIKAVGGKATFEIPGNLNAKSGLSVITITTITNITNPTPQCTNTANVIGNVTINPLPAAANIKILVNNNCLNGVFTAVVSGLGNLAKAKLSYLLLESNPSVEQNVDLNVLNGNASFVIPSNLLVNTGSTTISITYVTNDATSCGSTLVSVLDSFIINSIPAAPIAGNQEFCKVDRATIANLTPRGSQYKWYSSATSTTPLADSYVLKSEDYYIRETSPASCISPPNMISVLVNDVPAPILNPGGTDFCGLKNPTVADLSKATNVGASVAWYDAENNGNLLTSTTLLVHKATYYGFDLSNVTNCISDDYLEVSVSLSDCDPAQYAFFIPDGFSPNGDNVNDTFRIPDIEFLYPDYTIEIFNRYGNVMFKGNANTANWDGRNSESAGFGGGIAPNGVYFYIVNFNKDNRKAQQGRLYLNR